jgi:ankyrin repeat protein
MIKSFLQRDPGLLESRDPVTGDTTLMSVIRCVAKSPDTRLSLVRALIEEGADVNAKGDVGRSVLFCVFDSNLDHDRYYRYKRDVLHTLLHAGADPTVCDDEGASLLSWVLFHCADYAASILISDIMGCVSTRPPSGLRGA